MDGDATMAWDRRWTYPLAEAREAAVALRRQVRETARRMPQRIGVVLDFAHIKGWLSEEVSLRSVRKAVRRKRGGQ